MHHRKEASYYTKGEDGYVACGLCPHRCVIAPGARGRCRTRANDNGVLISRSYGHVASYGKDPIEKKPLYHFYPGTKIFSVGSFGCNFTCDFCQNYAISQESPKMIDTTARNLIDIACNEKENLGIAYTYNEPTIWYEFMTEIAQGIRAAGKKNVLVTNGYMNPEPLQELLPLIDAMNIDLKSMNPAFYQTHCGGSLDPVLEFIRLSAPACHVEITTLLIEGVNTSEAEIRQIAQFIASINPEIPLHLSRYFPAYNLNLPPTDIELMERLQTVAREVLPYVYIGNVPELDASTRCTHCGQVIVERQDGVRKHLKADGACSHCGAASPIILAGAP